MAHFHSPRIITDGLVLALDAANVKSFRGEPTVNLLTNPILSGTLGNTSPTSWGNAGTSTIRRLTSSTLFPNTNAWETSLTSNGTTGSTTSPVFSLLTDTTYTISIWVEDFDYLAGNFPIVSLFNTSISSGFRSIGRTGISNEQPSVSTSTKIVNERISFSFTTSAASTNSLIRIGSPHSSGGGYLRVSKVQIEQKSYTTPFVNGTRGANVATGGGWKDMTLSGNNGALTNSPTFDSDNLGSLVFDGADDYITLSNPNWSSIFNNTVGNNFSLRCIIKPTNIGTHQALISQRHGDAMSLFLLANGKVTLEMDDTNTRIGTTTTLQNNNWYDITVTFVNNTTQSRAYYYVNGQFERDELKWDGNGTTVNNNLWIGWQSRDNYSINPTYFNGNISQVQIYNRALTAQEVLQNYNATKGRYGL